MKTLSVIALLVFFSSAASAASFDQIVKAGIASAVGVSPNQIQLGGSQDQDYGNIIVTVTNANSPSGKLKCTVKVSVQEQRAFYTKCVGSGGRVYLNNY